MPSRHHSGGSWITPQRRLAIYLRDRFTCTYCGLDLTGSPRQDVTLDHLLSRDEFASLPEDDRLRFGSVNATHNLVTACKPCNSRRGSTPYTEFADTTAQSRILAARYRDLNMGLARALIAGTAGDPEVELR